MILIKRLEVNAELDPLLDLLFDLILLPFWIWRRICPVNGQVIETFLYPANLGHDWAVKYALVESGSKERKWICCQVNPASNLKEGMRIRRCLAGRLFYQVASKKVIIENY